MIDLLRWALQRHEKSKDEARQRLKLILVLDRIGLVSDHLDAMKHDIRMAVSKYLVVDADSIEMDMQRSETSLVLVSNIHVKEMVKEIVREEVPAMGFASGA
jgi:cell division topological specificity factor